MFARVLIVLALAASLAPAQRNARTPSMGNTGNNRNNDPFGNTNRNTNQRGNQQREVRGKSRFDDLATRLGLDKDQKKAVRTLFDQASKQAEPIRQQLQQANRELLEAVKAGRKDEEIVATAEKQAPLHAQMTALELRTFAQMFKELDPNQYKKAEEMLPRMAGFFQTKKWNTVD